jgi:heterodisulfide reductase subunit C
MQSPNQPAASVDQAREDYEAHRRYCRQCALSTSPCPAAKHLRRVYNNAARATRSS